MKNKLGGEKSPYLLQHADNPVFWYPWCEEAFSQAKLEKKPILLSIGYSTCHWCHVMAHESFEDNEVAQYLNEHFVSIKVDREERPDIDELYMRFVISLTGSGGWPMTVFLTPDKVPFFGGTYYPKQTFLTLLKAIVKEWNDNYEKIIAYSENVKKSLSNVISITREPLDFSKVVKLLDNELLSNFDWENGGFGTAPKFPRPMILDYLMQRYFYTKNEQFLNCVIITLEKMAKGGIYDQLGGGFARYSTDEKWLIPHFEKMLYDNALLAKTYLDAYVVTNNKLFLRIAEETLCYLERDMMAKNGGFFAAEDADSEGIEGKFYLWDKKEIDSILKEESELFCKSYGISETGNFINPHSKISGKNVLNWIGENELPDCKMKLFEVRNKRVRPHRDEKIITSWNGFAIRAFARAYAITQSKKYLDIAINTINFITSNLMKGSRLLRFYKDGASETLGFIDDYASFALALFDVFELTGDIEYYSLSKRLLDDAIKLFLRDDGFMTYGIDSEELIAKLYEIYDGATPSGNGMMAMLLMRHHSLSNDYIDILRKLILKFAGQISNYPQGYPLLVSVIDLLEREHIVMTVFDDLLKDVALKVYHPFMSKIIVRPENREFLSNIFALRGVKFLNKGATICVGKRCLPPVYSREELLKAIFE